MDRADASLKHVRTQQGSQTQDLDIRAPAPGHWPRDSRILDARLPRRATPAVSTIGSLLWCGLKAGCFPMACSDSTIRAGELRSLRGRGFFDKRRGCEQRVGRARCQGARRYDPSVLVFEVAGRRPQQDDLVVELAHRPPPASTNAMTLGMGRRPAPSDNNVDSVILFYKNAACRRHDRPVLHRSTCPSAELLLSSQPIVHRSALPSPRQGKEVRALRNLVVGRLCRRSGGPRPGHR